MPKISCVELDVCFACVCFQPFRNAELLVLQVDEVDALFSYCTFTKQKKKKKRDEQRHL